MNETSRGPLHALRAELAKRPWWLNGVWLFCLYMTFVYMPWDFFWKPMDRWEEVWFGFTIRGWPAKLTEPLHWAIYGAGAYGLWKMRPWLWPWAAVYSAQIMVAMVIFNVIAGPGMGDGRGGGWLASVVIGIFFAVLTVALWRAKPLFRGEHQPEASDAPPAA